MKTAFVMPKAGLTNTEGTISSWSVETGSRVKKGDIIGEMENEKSTIDLLAPADGLFVIIGQVGVEYKVGEIIGYVVDSMEEIDGAIGASTGPAVSSEQAESAEGLFEKMEKDHKVVSMKEEGRRIKISPYARKLAEEAGLDYSGLTGTGPAESIVSEDILKILAERAEGEVRQSQADRTSEKPQIGGPIQILKGSDEYEDRPASAMRKATAANMRRSLEMNATAHLSAEMDVTKLFELKDKLKRQSAILGNEVGLNDLLSYLVVKLAVRYPELNSCYLEGDIIRSYKHVNFSFAVSNDRGLITPVVREADRLSFNEFSRAIKEAIDKARNNALSPEEIKGGTITLSNLGMYAVDVMNPIINPPQTVIFGTGRAVDKPMYIDGDLRKRKMMWFSISFDHRNIDGAEVGDVFSGLQQILEDPSLLFVL